MNKANVNARYHDYKETPLHVAVQYNSPIVCKLLVDNGADIHAATTEGLTPLDYMKMYNRERELMHILKNGQE